MHKDSTALLLRLVNGLCHSNGQPKIMLKYIAIIALVGCGRPRPCDNQVVCPEDDGGFTDDAGVITCTACHTDTVLSTVTLKPNPGVSIDEDNELCILARQLFLDAKAKCK
jgi:hypothetical protein